MKFWDSSALVSLILQEPRSRDIEELLSNDLKVITVAIAPVEVSSAIWRRRHRGELMVEQIRQAEVLFAEISRGWTAIEQTRKVVDASLDVLTRHQIRTLDAIQLATAIVIDSRERLLPIVTLDQRLAAAARAEGFPILP